MIIRLPNYYKLKTWRGKKKFKLKTIWNYFQFDIFLFLFSWSPSLDEKPTNIWNKCNDKIKLYKRKNNKNKNKKAA